MPVHGAGWACPARIRGTTATTFLLFLLLIFGEGKQATGEPSATAPPVDGGPPTPSAGSLRPRPSWHFAESVVSRRT